MVVARNGRTAPTDGEVEIGSLIGLQNMIDVKLKIAPLGMGSRRLPCRAALLEFRFVHVKIEAAGLDIERQQVAVLDGGQRTTRRGLWGGVQDARPTCPGARTKPGCEDFSSRSSADLRRVCQAVMSLRRSSSTIRPLWSKLLEFCGSPRKGSAVGAV
jgi:hypothetical protein